MRTIAAEPWRAAPLVLGLTSLLLGPLATGPHPVGAQPPPPARVPDQHPTLLAETHFGGASLAVATEGDRIYVGEGPVLAVYLDLGEAGGLELLGRSEVLPGLVVDIETSGDLAVLSLTDSPPDPIDFQFGGFGPPGGLAVIDVSRPQHPRVVAMIEDLTGLIADLGWREAESGEAVVHARRMVLDPPWLFVATDGGLISFDLSRPDRPNALGRFEVAGFGVQDMAYRAPILYANTILGPQVIDMSEPERPKILGCMRFDPFGPEMSALELVGRPDRAPDQDDACLDFFLEGARMEVSARRLALSWFGEIWIFDLGNPTRPALGGRWFANTLADLRIQGDRLFGLDEEGRLVTLDLSQAGTFEGPIAQLDLPGQGRALGVAEDRAYVATGHGGLRVVDLSQLEHPREIASQIGAPQPEQVEIVEDLAYVVDPLNGLQVFDLGTGRLPVKRSAYQMPQAVELSIDGSTGYLRSDGNELRMLDLSLPARPRELGPITLPSRVSSMLAEGGRIYVGRNVFRPDDGGRSLPALSVFEASGDRALLRADLDVQRIGQIAGMERVGNLLLALGPGGLALFDLTRPSIPEPLGTYYLPRGHRAVHDMTVAGQLVFLALGESARMVVVDISEPRNPVEVAVLPEDGSRLIDLLAADGRIYAAELRPETGSAQTQQLSLLVLVFSPERGFQQLDRRPIPELTWQARFFDGSFVGATGASLARWQGRLLLADPRSGVHVYRLLEGARIFFPSVMR